MCKLRSTPLDLLSGFLALIIFSPFATAQTTATWTGAGDGVSYNDGANWDLGIVPLNGGGNSYIVVIPGSRQVEFNVPGTGHQVFQLELANGSTLTVNSARDLEVIDQASIDGLVATAGGTFNAN